MPVGGCDIVDAQIDRERLSGGVVALHHHFLLGVERDRGREVLHRGGARAGQPAAPVRHAREWRWRRFARRGGRGRGEGEGGERGGGLALGREHQQAGQSGRVQAAAARGHQRTEWDPPFEGAGSKIVLVVEPREAVHGLAILDPQHQLQRARRIVAAADHQVLRRRHRAGRVEPQVERLRGGGGGGEEGRGWVAGGSGCGGCGLRRCG
jgi:hypothetical protein